MSWRATSASDDEAIERLCLALYEEDRGPDPVPPAHIRRTLERLRREPWRGRALVLDLEGELSGYALLISFWSNELGGEVVTIDELYVAPQNRGRRYATRFLETLAAGSEPWVPRGVALSLEVTPNNQRARRLYERLGFVARNLAMRLRLPS